MTHKDMFKDITYEFIRKAGRRETL
jgi:hypothetical protein